MALHSSKTLERKDVSAWTREQEVTETVRYMRLTGAPMSRSQIEDLFNILIAVDDYCKGTTTSMDAIKANYTAWVAAPNVRP